MLTRDFLDERLVPELEYGTVQYFDHIRRYLFAQEFARGKRTADIACGTGYGSRLLAQAGSRSVLSIDLAPDALRYAGRVSPDTDAINWLQADGMHLPLADSTIDLIVSFETLEHMPDPDRFLTELRRILAPDGLLIFSVPNRDVASPGSAVPFSPYHHFEPTLAELDPLLHHSGWKIDARHGLYHSARAQRLLHPARGVFDKQPHIMAWSAILRRVALDLLPPLVYQRLRKAPQLEISDSILTRNVDQSAAYFICVCTPLPVI